ncbi:hypothetical protein HNQ07_003730 [Deinococcus metalli]|uniref:PatA-like N-terminal domain-containing protein n=1 Tax=Deinococcus metalli TaxID=1141878 RepID=A0A7W8NPR1_9DEIO|nr:DUF4388 domain-containing protein [Deinococcus metalli]MBB5378229.1 hypothetical protein [Deinococcus metalli]GHF56998.1 hypothetical protein GCM10017781_36680 [Deinococcus metalli]
MAHPSSSLRVLFVSDTIPPLGEYLCARSAALQQCEITDSSQVADAMKVMGDAAPNLVVLQLSAGRQDVRQLMEHANVSWPHTAFLAFSTGPDVSAAALVEIYGDMTTFESPDVADLQAGVERELERLCFGQIRGVSLPNLLQMLHWERRSVSLFVRRGEGDAWGRFHLRAGSLVDAYMHESGLSGEAAALELLTWQHAATSLERSYRNQHTRIHTPLQSLLMEAMKRHDESTRHTPSGEGAGVSTPPEEDMFFRRKTPPTPPPPAIPSLPSPPPPPESSTALSDTPPREVPDMSNVSATLDSALSSIEGAVAAALVDYSSGMPLGKVGTGVNLDMAAAGNTEVVRAKLRTMDMLGIKGDIEDILITLNSQYHILYIIPNQPLFLYLVLNRDRANLAMARYKLKALGTDIAV